MTLGTLLAIIVAGTAAVATLLQYMSNRREKKTAAGGEKDRARTEAVQLAETRGQMLDDMRRRVDDLKEQLDRERKHSDAAIHRLESALELSRDEAQETQRLLAVGFSGVLGKLLGHLEADPVEVEAAKRYVQEMLNVEPLGPRARRRSS